MKDVHDSFHGFLPGLLGGMETVDLHNIDRMHTKSQALYLKGVEHADTMAGAGRVAGGSVITMLVSSDRDNTFNQRELDENMTSALAVQHSLKTLLIDNDVHVIEDYDRDDLERALADTDIGHLMFFGHAKRGGVFVPRDPINWRNLEPAGHLKKSIGSIGCGVYDRCGVTPRFGYNIVDPSDGVLYGTRDAEGDGSKVNASQMRSLSNFSVLSPRMQTTKPSQEATSEAA